MKHEAWELAQMQSLSLDAKIRMSKQRIQAFYDHFDGNVCVSFSGGKDSTVLLHLVRSLYPDVKGVYVDTGLEYPEIKEFVKKQDNIDIVRPEKSFRQVIQEYGYPVVSKETCHKVYWAKKGKEWAIKFVNGTSKDKNGEVSKFCIAEKWRMLMDAPFEVSALCCNVMKKEPIHQYQRQNHVVPFIGTLAEESVLRKQAWEKTGCNAFDDEHPEKSKSTPLAFWTNQDILQYLKRNNIEIASVYGDIVETPTQLSFLTETVPKLDTTGVKRTGCVFCMFGAHLEERPNRFDRMKITHPQLYEYCMKPIEQGGLGLKEVLDYIGVKY